ncbi:histone deacetylase [Pontibacter sp. G13]|uniref:histone deacetylase family protein n=1 Tax=Pontibacter sp. G13 TaxID=3074898 RepID=UPI002889374B|nr:histone deacetylase [Pontibacter sp. G13]WNJ18543.1 histone deacetylase [Pontibacter sp. G13]
MDKYVLIPQQLKLEGTLTESQFYDPGKVDAPTVLMTHTQAYWTKLTEGTLTPREARKTGFPFSPLLVERAVSIAQGTLHNALHALEHGCAINGAGGTHHAFTGHGEGFCILNDFGIAANWLLHEGLVERILIVDLDVHQGNGTAEIFRNEPRVFTFSMHCEANYPMHKETSDLDLALPAYLEDQAYLEKLEEVLPNLLDHFHPDMVFYLAGVDILATDKLGKLSISPQGCAERDRFVIQSCRDRDIPMAISLGGGYSPDIWDIVEAHCQTFRIAQEVWN